MRAGVLGGLALCAWAGVDADTPGDRLPGVALGSTTVLQAERAAVLFAAWLFVFVVVTQAWRGQLPTELSGRGVKYADGEGTQESVRETKTALRDLDDEIRRVRVELGRLDRLARGEG